MNQLNVVQGASLFTSTGWMHQGLLTLYTGDIRRPWQSVFGFPMTVAYLAARQALILSSREDEVFDLVGQLNDLIGRPEVLNRVYTMLKKLEEETRHKLGRLVALEEESIAAGETETLLEAVEQFLAESKMERPAGRLAEILSPDKPAGEINGLRNILTRLQNLIPALEMVKDQGFHVVVDDRQRQPDRPALEARRHEPILLDGKPSSLAAGFLQPAKSHLTLWNYLVVRSDHGQAMAWN
jgi:hypothetical protein